MKEILNKVADLFPISPRQFTAFIIFLGVLIAGGLAFSASPNVGFSVLKQFTYSADASSAQSAGVAVPYSNSPLASGNQIMPQLPEPLIDSSESSATTTQNSDTSVPHKDTTPKKSHKVASSNTPATPPPLTTFPQSSHAQTPTPTPTPIAVTPPAPAPSPVPTPSPAAKPKPTSTPSPKPTPPPAPTPTPAPKPTTTPPPPPPTAATPTPTPAPKSSTTNTSYDSVVLADKPVMYLEMNSAKSGKENDASGHGHTGTYDGGTPSSSTLPNGDSVSVFNGTSQYVDVPNSSAFSISTTKMLTWEAWIRPDVANFGVASDDGYVDWMGKCQDYSPTCEWEARIYSTDTAEGRPNRLSAYVFNSSAGLGSAADWQPQSGWFHVGKWVHVVAEYDLTTTPSGCDSAQPGDINIWVNGVKQDFGSHAPTGCMSQYEIVPKANSSDLMIGTMAMDTWFKGAIGKVAIYNHLLTPAQINAHFKAMTGKTPTGSCAEDCSALSL